MIYLDNAATTFPKPEAVYKSLDEANRSYAFNAGRGVYRESEKISNLIQETRNMLSDFANGNGLIFTASATQALNNIIFGLSLSRGDIVYCSPYDHNAIVRPLHELEKKNGIIVKQIPLTMNGDIDLEKLEFSILIDKPKLLICTHVSNVTGYILPIQRMGEIVKKSDCVFVVDGSQAFGITDIDLKKYNIDYYVFAGHKTLYGPFGIAGYIYVENNLNCTFFGGTGSDSLNLNMPEDGNARYEPSSPNSVAIMGLLHGFKWMIKHDIYNKEQELMKYFCDSLNEIDGVVIYRDDNLHYSGIVSFNLEGYLSEDLARVLSEEYNICVRGGYHCCPFIHSYLNTKKYSGTVRVSVSYFNSKEDIDALLEAIDEISLE